MWQLHLIWCFLAVFAESVTSEVEYAPIVRLNDGQVRGIVQQSQDGLHKSYFYQGIRYGRANRFSKPVPVEPWTRVYNATEYRDACPQLGFGKPPNVRPFFTETMSEDCLFVNVWRPVEERTNRTVMVWIHGGGYLTGTIFTQVYDGQYIATQGDMVLVSINYRVGPLGFLYGATQNEPGNLGLHDQILALQWVQENIHRFTGDPNKVTIFGQSAGSYAVGSLVLSPLTKGLFRRAILQSGAPNSFYGKMSKEESLKVTKLLANHTDCSSHNETIEQIVKCLRTKSIQQIVSFNEVGGNQDERLYRPIYGDDVLPIKPEIALQTGQFNREIDLLYGVTSNEGSGFAMALVPDVSTGKQLTLQSTKDAIVRLEVSSKSSYSEEVAQFYTSKLAQNATQDQLKKSIAAVWADHYLVCPEIFFGEQFGAHSPNRSVYLYQLVRPSFALNCPGWMSVCHGEDVAYLFMIPLIKSNSELLQLSRDMIQAWTTFAKTGHPGKIGQVEWSDAFDRNADDHSIRSAVTKHLSLDSADYKMVDNFFKETCDVFWKPKIFN